MSKFAFSVLFALSSFFFIQSASASDPIKLTINSNTLGLFSVICEEASANNYVCQDEVVDLATCAQSFQGVLDNSIAVQVCDAVSSQALNPNQFASLKQVFTDLYSGAKDDASEANTVISYVAGFSVDQTNYFRILSSSLFSGAKDDLNEFEAIAGMAMSLTGATASFYQYIAVPMFSSSKDDLDEIQAIFNIAQNLSIRPCFSSKISSISQYYRDDLDEIQAIVASCTAP
jgi:hypothetical protein